MGTADTRMANRETNPEQEALSSAVDTLLISGRCIDPESGLDGIRHVAISEGRIVQVLDEDAQLPPASSTIDCTGLVVCPGFVDLHSHGAGHPPTAKMQVQDGVTFHGEFEFGACDVNGWYNERKGRSIIHHGVTSGHIPNRVQLLTARHLPEHEPHKPHSHGPHLLDCCFCTKSDTHHIETNAEEVEHLVEQLQAGLAAGALGLGLGIQYTSAADHEEIYRLFQLGCRAKVPLFIHSRGTFKDLTDFHEMFANAAASGASLHICHINSSGGVLNLPLIFEMIEGLNSHGTDVTAEAYSFTAGMTRLDSGVFEPGWADRIKCGPADLEWIATGERLTWDNFEEKRAEGGLVAVHNVPEHVIEQCMRDKQIMVASDAIPYDENGKGHPRAAGCFSRVLGTYVREKQVVSLPDAIAKMTLLPARRLEAVCAAFKKKGRLQEGVDADVCVFDPATIRERATFQDPMLASEGVKHVFVNGVPLVADGQFVEGVTPGVGYRSDIFCDDRQNP